MPSMGKVREERSLSKPVSPILMAVAAAALFGAAAPLLKSLTGAVDTFELAGLLYLGACLGVLPFVLSPGQAGAQSSKKSAANWSRLTVALLCGGVAAPVCLLMGLILASAASVSMWLCLESAFTAVLAWLFFKEH